MQADRLRLQPLAVPHRAVILHTNCNRRDCNTCCRGRASHMREPNGALCSIDEASGLIHLNRSIWQHFKALTCLLGSATAHRPPCSIARRRVRVLTCSRHACTWQNNGPGTRRQRNGQRRRTRRLPVPSISLQRRRHVSQAAESSGARIEGQRFGHALAEGWARGRGGVRHDGPHVPCTARRSRMGCSEA
jgi:hypothetical protein